MQTPKLRLVQDWKTQRRELQERVGQELYRSFTGEVPYSPELGPAFYKDMAEGHTLEECVVKHRLSLRTVTQWCTPQSPVYHEDFANWVVEGATACYAWWLKQAKENLSNRSFNDKMWEKIMKHIFGWVERQELTGAGGAPLMGDTDLGAMDVATRVASLLALAEKRRTIDQVAEELL